MVTFKFEAFFSNISIATNKLEKKLVIDKHPSSVSNFGIFQITESDTGAV
jgi:hypothetical protein